MNTDMLVIEDNGLARLDTEAAGMAITETRDSNTDEIINLPTYQDVTDQSVNKSIQEVFHGFDSSIALGHGSSFEDIEMLANYTNLTMQDIRAIRKKSTVLDIMNKAASMARLWYLGRALDKELVNGDYGTATSTRLANLIHVSVPYIYQIRAIATKLSLVDCYLLGMRGCESVHLRRLTQVRDDETRQGIVRAFIDMFKDTSDPDRMEQARKQLVAAVNAGQPENLIAMGSSAQPTEEESQQQQVFSALMSKLGTIQKAVTKLNDDKLIGAFKAAAADFYTDEPGINDIVQDRIGELNIGLDKLQESICCIREELQSLEQAGT